MSALPGTWDWLLAAAGVTSVSGINSSLEVSLISYSTIRGVILFYFILFIYFLMSQITYCRLNFWETGSYK